MKRLMLDTCVVIDMLVDFDGLDKNVITMLEDPSYVLCASFETMRELVVHFNNKKLLSRQWKTAYDVIHTVEKDLEIEFLPLRDHVGYTYSRLILNEEQDHRDPSDHVIISHAITEQIPLLSSDTRFWFYRNQGLDLIEY
ncbi:MAG: PIN domain-containing protein [Bacteroidales bacterium]|nr:PIN domain-containing protein [Bacteroidales bacterium]